jgi:hypothetical protein
MGQGWVHPRPCLRVAMGVAASSVAVPVLGYAVAGDRLDEPLGPLRA